MQTYPMYKSQEGLYVESINNQGEPVFTICVETELRTDTDLEKLAAAFDKALAAHSFSRIRYMVNDLGEPRQYLVDEPTKVQLLSLSDSEFQKLRASMPVAIDLCSDELIKVFIVQSETQGKWILMQFHHTIYDGTSLAILTEDIRSILAGKEIEPEKKSIPEIAQDEIAVRESDFFQEARKWYADIFSGIETESTFLPDVHSYDAAYLKDKSLMERAVRMEFDVNVPYQEVFDASRRMGVRFSILVDGAFGYMAGKFLGADEATFCTIYAGRKDPMLSHTPCYMVKNLPVYCHWQKDTKVVDYLKELNEQRENAKKYDIYSLTDVSSELKFRSDIMFSYRGSINPDKFDLGGLDVKSRRLGRYTTGEQMYIILDHIDDHLRLTIEYPAAKYSPEMIQSIANAYTQVLGQIIKVESLAEIKLLDEQTAREYEERFHHERPYDDTVTPVDMFRTQAANTPDHDAVVCKDVRLTYRVLDDISDRIAGFLHSKGIGRGGVVSVLIPRNEYMAIASIGVLKSGAAYQPLDPSYPTERLNFMVKDSNAQLLILDRELDGLITEFAGEKLYTDEIASLPKADADMLKVCSPVPSDRFVLLYTSGSTGVPKGCQLLHSNLTAFIAAAQTLFHYDSTSKSTAYASYGFDANMYDLYPGLTHGSTVYVITEDIRFDLVALNEYFKKVGITHAFMTTQVARALVTSIDVAPSVQYISTGGETLVPVAPPKDYTLFNVYGPTECTIFMTAQEVDKEYDRVPIGQAMDNTRLYVVDSNGHQLPLGGVGELYISGPQVAMGYLNRPEKTAEVFINNPFSDNPKYAHVYRTGDVVRRLTDGRIDFIGRADGQVKVRGFRIELSEVEGVIREYPGITDATVTGFDDPSGGKAVAAYIVSPETIDIEALNAFIRERKPPYMVPAVTMQIDKIPLNQNQKVNRRALPKPELNVTPKAEQGGAPRVANVLEVAIQQIVGAVIKVEDADITTPLEMLGLTSISSIRLAVALYKRFGVEFKATDFSSGASIETIENRLLEQWLSGKAPAHEETAKADTAKKKEDFDTLFPLTISQQGVYADSMRNPQSTTYNIPLCYRFPASLDSRQLADCFGRFLQAHPYINTALVMSDADIQQETAREQVTEVKIKRMSDEQFTSYCIDFIRPFNLMKAPLYDAEVVQTDNAVYLLFDVHHIVFDGTSGSIMLNELKTLLEGGAISEEETTYYDYIRKETSSDMDEAKKYFASMLADCESASEITPDLPQSSDGDWGDGRKIFCNFDFPAIDTFCREHHITPAALLLAATGYTVGRFTGSHNAYLSTVSTGRSDVHFARTVGMFVKTLPVAVEIADVSALEFTERTASMLRNTVAHEMYPYSTICSDFNYAPHIMYEYQLGVMDEVTVAGHKIERLPIVSDTLKFKLSIKIEEHEGKPCVVIYYKDKLYSHSLMQTLAQSIVTVAQRIIENPQGKVCKLSMLTVEDEARVRSFSRVNDPCEASHKLFYRMFESQVDLCPEKEILVAADGRFTYRQLDDDANRTAHALMARGLQKGDKVVVLLSRTSRYFTTVFGVSKAGGVFIPTNPDYPQERINSIVEDSEARFIITEGELVKAYDKAIDVAELTLWEDASRPSVDVQPSDLVYMIYTSGSTGKPKGVELRHESICNYLENHEVNIQVHYPVHEGSCYGAVTTVAFDMSFKEWAVSLCNGLKLVFASDRETLDPMLLAKTLNENGVDVFNATPSRLLQYMEVEEFEKAMTRCKVIISGGEKYPSKLLNLLREKTSARILNTYGPTEITVSSNAADLTSVSSITIGYPLLNYEEYIVDADDNLLPVGVVGELIICGIGVGSGYHNLPEQTEKAFIQFEGKTAYRSGDFARWHADGCVEILGRKDNQVKIRGLRIELGEIEKVLTDVEGVKSGIILIRKLGNQEAICAYYTLELGATLTSEDIRTVMSSRLTDYMVPTAFVELESMPLTPNGKVNTKILPEPQVAERQGGIAPRNDTERFFADIFAQVTGNETVYADDNFFEIGGSSLTVTRVIIAANKAGMNVAYVDVFDNPTPEKLAAFVNKGKSGETASPYADFEDISAYDYTAINNVLANNNLCSFLRGERQTFSHVLLTGATGFLGIHVLYELLNNYPDCRVTCMLRGKGELSALARMQGLFFYYFEAIPGELFGNRLTVIEGDITSSEDFEKCRELGIDMVLNCAANVKHFSKGTDIEDVNYYGTLNIIRFCQQVDARLVHVSTMSVGGVYVGTRGAVAELHEDLLFYGQKQLSKYTQSKYLAERAILQAVADGKLSAKIMRVGTLAPRNKDGEYQINFTTNSFMARMKSTYLVGAYSYESETSTFELSPIDAVAQAIVLLSHTPKENVVFHPFNNHQLLMGDLYATMNRLGLSSKAVEEDVYRQALEEAEQDPAKAKVLTGLLAYRQREGVKTYGIAKAAPLTVAILYRMGFHWPMTDSAYTERFIIALRGLGFFDE